MSVATYASSGIFAAGGAPGTDLDALIDRIRCDIALRGGGRADALRRLARFLARA